MTKSTEQANTQLEDRKIRQTEQKEKKHEAYR